MLVGAVPGRAPCPDRRGARKGGGPHVIVCTVVWSQLFYGACARSPVGPAVFRRLRARCWRVRLGAWYAISTVAGAEFPDQPAPPVAWSRNPGMMSGIPIGGRIVPPPIGRHACGPKRFRLAADVRDRAACAWCLVCCRWAVKLPAANPRNELTHPGDCRAGAGRSRSGYAPGRVECRSRFPDRITAQSTAPAALPRRYRAVLPPRPTVVTLVSDLVRARERAAAADAGQRFSNLPGSAP